MGAEGRERRLKVRETGKHRTNQSEVLKFFFFLFLFLLYFFNGKILGNAANEPDWSCLSILVPSHPHNFLAVAHAQMKVCIF